MGNFGTFELKAVLNLAFVLAKIGEQAAKGIKVGLLVHVWALVKAAPPAISAIKSGLVIKEFKELDEAEQTELIAWTADNFDLENDNAEVLVENGLGMIYKLSNLLNIFNK